MPEGKAAPKTETKKEAPKSGYTDKEIKEGKSIAWLSYFGLLALIPYFAQKENKYTHAHAIRGLNLLIVDIAWGVLMGILTSVIKIEQTSYLWGYPYTYTVTPWWLQLISAAGYIFIGVVSIMGIVYACQGKVKDLPLVGKIKIIKK